MRLGFLILSVKPPDVVFSKLLEFIHGFDEGGIYLHHDYTKSGFPEDVISKYNIKVVKPYYKTYWSHINNVYATIAGLKMMYLAKPNLDWFVTVTPNCFPIKSRAFIQQFYDNATDDVFVDMHKVKDNVLTHVDEFLLRDMGKQPWFKIPFITKKGKFTWRQVRKTIRVAKNPFLNGKNEYYQGSNYFSLSRKAVKAIVEDASPIKQLLSFYKANIVETPNMHPCPQETIIQTFLGNQAGLKINYDNFRYIDWENAVNWSPNWLNESYFERLQQSKCHWARKLGAPQSIGLMNLIEKELV